MRHAAAGMPLTGRAKGDPAVDEPINSRIGCSKPPASLPQTSRKAAQRAGRSGIALRPCPSAHEHGLSYVIPGASKIAFNHELQGRRLLEEEPLLRPLQHSGFCTLVARECTPDDHAPDGLGPWSQIERVPNRSGRVWPVDASIVWIEPCAHCKCSSASGPRIRAVFMSVPQHSTASTSLSPLQPLGHPGPSCPSCYVACRVLNEHGAQVTTGRRQSRGPPSEMHAILNVRRAASAAVLAVATLPTAACSPDGCATPPGHVNCTAKHVHQCPCARPLSGVQAHSPAEARHPALLVHMETSDGW